MNIREMKKDLQNIEVIKHACRGVRWAKKFAKVNKVVHVTATIRENDDIVLKAMVDVAYENGKKTIIEMIKFNNEDWLQAY
jgi:hypothetical protein